MYDAMRRYFTQDPERIIISFSRVNNDRQIAATGDFELPRKKIHLSLARFWRIVVIKADFTKSHRTFKAEAFWRLVQLIAIPSYRFADNRIFAQILRRHRHGQGSSCGKLVTAAHGKNPCDSCLAGT